MTTITTEEKREIVRIRNAFKELEQPNIFDGQAYCVRVNDEFSSIKTRKNIVKCMPYSGAYMGRVHEQNGLYIIVDTQEKEELDRYPIPYIEKRFRDSTGTLTMRVNDLITATKDEAMQYYRPDMLYLVRGNPAILKEYESGCIFHTEKKILRTTTRSEMGVFLPDVSSYGQEVIAFNDKRYINARTQNAINKAAKAIVVRPPARTEIQHAR